MVKMPDVTPKYTGIINRPIWREFFRRRTPYSVIRKMIEAKAPAIAGAINQAATTCATPFLAQLQETPSLPMVAIPTPIMPPMILC